MSDIENKNTSTGSGSDEENVVLRTTDVQQISSCTEDQRISGNVQILKKSFEAKAGSIGGVIGGVAVSQVQNTNSAITGNSSNKTSKGHQSLPSSPVAQHGEHHPTPQQASKSFLEQNNTNIQAVMESDRNVKGLVHKYQTSTSITPTTAIAAVAKISTNPTSNPPPASTSSINTITTVATFKPRPRSYYEPQRSLSGKPHEFSESRPPPAPQKTGPTNLSSSHHINEGILTQQHQPPQQRRLQQHGKTHPLARLSLPKQSFNAAAYNTM